MNSRITKLGFLFLLATFILSCDKEKEPSVIPEALLGEWHLKTVDSELDYQNKEPRIQNKDVSAQEIYFEFYADHTYTTNGIIELGDIMENNGTESANTYTFENSVLGLKYVEPSLGIPITLYFNAEFKGNSLSLKANKEDLIKAFDETIDTGLLTQLAMNIYLNTITSFEFNILLEK